MYISNICLVFQSLSTSSCWSDRRCTREIGGGDLNEIWHTSSLDLVIFTSASNPSQFTLSGSVKCDFELLNWRGLISQDSKAGQDLTLSVHFKVCSLHKFRSSKQMLFSICVSTASRNLSIRLLFPYVNKNLRRVHYRHLGYLRRERFWQDASPTFQVDWTPKNQNMNRKYLPPLEFTVSIIWKLQIVSPTLSLSEGTSTFRAIFLELFLYKYVGIAYLGNFFFQPHSYRK